MIIPLIYSNKKFISIGEVITLTSNTDNEIVWEFPNIDSSNFEIVDGVLSSKSISFKSLINIDPLIVTCLIVENDVQNSEHWTDGNADGLADWWSGIPFGVQVNSIETTGWNFTGKSQRVVQSTHASPRLYQDGITVDGGSYRADLKYRSSTDLTLSIGGHTFALSTTEFPPFAIFPIAHNEGVVNFMQSGGSNPRWVLADGTYEYDNEINKSLPAGTSYLIVDNFNGVDVTSVDTGALYVGSLSDVPFGVAILEFKDTGVIGDIAELNHIQDVVYISNASGIYGDIVSLSGVSSVIDLNGSSGITGSISVLTATNLIMLNDCSVSGVVPSDTNCFNWYLNGTTLLVGDIETSLINLADRAELLSIVNGTFECYDASKVINTTLGCDAIYRLETLGWSVIVYSDCYFG